MNEYLLIENGDYLLQETGDKIITSVSVIPQNREFCDRNFVLGRELVENRDVLDIRDLV